MTFLYLVHQVCFIVVPKFIGYSWFSIVLIFIFLKWVSLYLLFALGLIMFKIYNLNGLNSGLWDTRNWFKREKGFIKRKIRIFIIKEEK